MKSYNAETLAMLDTGAISIRGFIRFDFATGTYGFWTGSRSFELGGINYLPGGVLEVSEIDSGIGMSAEGLEITLAESSQDGLTPSVLATIENEIYHQRPVFISDGYFHPETGALINLIPIWSGYVDAISHEGGQENRIVIKCESKNLDNNREGYRVRSTLDQQNVSPGDRFFEHAEVAGRREYFWGRDRPQ